ncbi:hypothetical protein C8R43DRAFT_407332 [Mycena crocata]|nr:hypothetical protein C8R43DRAFT_407332 [Mycena crocata]
MPRADHRLLRRAITDLLNGPNAGGENENAGSGGNSAGSSSTSPVSVASKTTTTKPSPSATVTKNPNGTGNSRSDTTTTSTTSKEKEETTTSEKKSETSEVTTSSTSASASASVVSVSPSNTAKSAESVVKNTGVAATTPKAAVQTGVQTTAPVATISASSAPAVAASGDINVGAVIGGVVAGIAGITIIFFVIMFFIRRRRNRENFDPDTFRKSAVMVDENADPFNPRPPTMIERKLNSHHVAPSITSMNGAGMAGAGAYSNHGHVDEQQQQYDEQYAQEQYSVSHQPIQPRQQYTYGQSYEHDTYEQQGSETGHGAEYNGAYSSDPQQQGIYAAEAYAYPGEDQVVSPGMEAQDMGRHQQQHQQQYDHRDAYGGM